MYTNIPTEPALALISTYLRAHENKTFHHYNAETLITAIQIIFRHNFIQFAHNEILWTNFKSCMQNWHGLEWEFTPPSLTCNFIDLTLSIVNNRVTTTIYEKKHNLYLYIPPQSAHPSGITKSLVFGYILCLHCLCTNRRDIQHKSQEFFQCLTKCGHTPKVLTPLFQKAHNKAVDYLTRQHQARYTQPHPPLPKTFLHLPYHPQDPSHHTIQHLWYSIIARPHNQTPLCHIHNLEGYPTNIDHLTIAYSWPQNLGNQLSLCKIHGRGVPVSSYIDHIQDTPSPFFFHG
ncbi:hypothetical protein ACHAW6_004142 [Cyclotella cf. meneghiniana]